MSIVDTALGIVNTGLQVHHSAMNDMSSFGQFVRTRRVYRHQTNRDLALAVGMDPATLSRLENGGMKTLPDPALLRRLADALQVTIPDLLEAAGYLTEADRQQVNANPFPRDDIRYRVVEAMKSVDMEGDDYAFWHGHYRLQLRMYRDIATYGINEDDDPDVTTMELVLHEREKSLDDPSKDVG